MNAIDFLEAALLYTSIPYYGMVIALVIIYYILPKQSRWLALLAGSVFFYAQVFGSYEQLAVFLSSILISYLSALLIQKLKAFENIAVRRIVLFSAVFLSVAPLLAEKLGELIYGADSPAEGSVWIVPVGLSFYTLQMVAYLVDIHKGKVKALEKP